MNFYLIVSRTWCTCLVALEDVILIFLIDLKTKLCKLNQKEVESVHYIKVYSKGLLKKSFCLCRSFRREFALSITFKTIDAPDRLWSKIHPRYFTFSHCLIAVPLHTMLKVLAFRSLYLVPNKTNFVFS